MAMKIDKMSHDKKKETVEKNWFKEKWCLLAVQSDKSIMSFAFVRDTYI